MRQKALGHQLQNATWLSSVSSPRNATLKNVLFFHCCFKLVVVVSLWYKIYIILLSSSAAFLLGVIFFDENHIFFFHCLDARESIKRPIIFTLVVGRLLSVPFHFPSFIIHEFNFDIAWSV